MFGILLGLGVWMGGIVGSAGSGVGVGVVTAGVLGVVEGLEVWLGAVPPSPETWEECETCDS